MMTDICDSVSVNNTGDAMFTHSTDRKYSVYHENCAHIALRRALTAYRYSKRVDVFARQDINEFRAHLSHSIAIRKRNGN